MLFLFAARSFSDVTFISDNYKLDFYIAEISSPIARVLIGYFKVT